MDIMVFPPQHGMDIWLKNASLLTGWNEATWIERYRDAGEFTIKADHDIRDQIPLGSFISHVNTRELMIVEDHHISSGLDGMELTITGRSFETFLDQRAIGFNVYTRTYAYLPWGYRALVDRPWRQAAKLIRDHIYPPALYNPKNGISTLVILESPDLQQELISPNDIEKLLEQGYVYTEVLKLLESEDIGIRSLRPGKIPGQGDNGLFALEFHRGEDKSKTVSFSYENGDLESAEYFWSLRKYKNAVLVHGKWLNLFVDVVPEGYDRRWLYLDATDIAEDLTFNPVMSPSAVNQIVGMMGVRGAEALKSQKMVSLVNPKLSPTQRYQYRHDYNVGDIVSIDGEYNTTTKMRITEYVEISSKEGETGYPSLSELEES